jgi:acetylornithine/succinyldiaminopimelate/putrescine aminotransferase
LGLVVNVTDPATVRMLPPLIVVEAQIDEAVEIFGRALG